MRRTSECLIAMGVALLLALAVGAQSQEPRRPVAPMLTNDDVLSPRAAISIPEESINKTNLSGSPLRNAKPVLESALTRMSEINSMRTRIETSLPTGHTEAVIESVKPDRMHVMSQYVEMIAIGRKFYLKRNGSWEVTSIPAGGSQPDSGLDFKTFVKQMVGKAGVRITGQVLGSQMIDGVETLAYEFAVTDGSETGTIQINVGKEDGFMRRMSLLGGPIGIKIWFTGINEKFSIEPPM